MSIEKAEIEKVLSPEGILGGMRRRPLRPDPSIALAIQLLTTVPEAILNDDQQFRLIVCFNHIDHWPESGSEGEKAYHRILGLLRLAQTEDRVSSADPEVLAKLAESVSLLIKHRSLNQITLQALVACADPKGVATALSAEQLAPEDINQILGLIGEPAAKIQKTAEEVMPVEAVKAERNPDVQGKNNTSLAGLSADMKKLLFSYLPARDKKSLAQTDRQLRGFFEQRLEDNGGIKVVVDTANTAFTTFFNKLLRSQPKDMEDLIASRADVVIPGELQITQLLIHVVKGDIEHAEAMLQENSELLLRKGRVMDFSERTFGGKGISAFQYALAAQDILMRKMLLQYFPKTEEGKAAVAGQYAETAEMLTNEKAENHKAVKNLNASIADVHQKLGDYLKKYKDMDYDKFQKNKEAVKHDWCVVVGGAYRKVPAWVVETMCEVGKDVAWVKKDLALPVKRECAHLVWLFDTEQLGGRCGAAWAPVRGVREVVAGLSRLVLKGKGWQGAEWDVRSLPHDISVMTNYQSAHQGNLPKLESLDSGDKLRSTSSSGPARQ